MKNINWNSEKNEKLKRERGVNFELIVESILEGGLLGIEENSNYPNQENFIVELDNYCYIVPFVENEEGVFLKTIIPSRKKTKD